MRHDHYYIVRGLAMLAVLLFFCVFPAYAGENLLENPDFVAIDTDGYPEGWYTDAYILDPGYSLFTAEEELKGRTSVVTINNVGQNDARFAQVVPVEPDSLYCLSGYILADHVEGKHGANLSIEGVYAFSEELFDTGGEWQYVEYYGETGPDQEYITVFARVGGYSGESTGKASFDQLSLTKVDSVPGDTVADLWFSRSQYQDQNDDTEDGDDVAAPAWPWLLLAGCLYACISMIVISQFKDRPDLQAGKGISRRNLPAEILILILALLFRMLLSHTVQGYMVDVNCFLSWGRTMAENGPAQFYQATSFCDYPPLYTYIMGLNSLVSSRLNAGPAMTQLIFRFVPCLCDVVSSWLLYRILIRKREVRSFWSLFFLAFLAMNCATVLNSAGWGQMDSVLCLLLLLVAVLAMEKKWAFALPVYVVSVLVKPQALMLGPLGLVFAVIFFLRDKDSRRQILLGIAASILVLFAGAGPFVPGQDSGTLKTRMIITLLTGFYPILPSRIFAWLFELYGGTLSSYPYATLNTANFFYLAGGNWARLSSSSGIVAPLLLANLSLGFGILWFFRSRSLRFRITESLISAAFFLFFTVAAFAGASWSLIGTASMAFSFVIVMSAAIRSGRIGLLAYLGGLLFVLLYVFGIKMHERYVFPALLLFAAAFAVLRDRRILYLIVLFTVTLFINEGIVLDNSIRLGSEYGHLNPDTVWLADILCVLNIVGACFAVFLNVDLLCGRDGGGRKRGPFLPVRSLERRNVFAYHEQDRKLHWTWKDSLILLAITLVYSAVSLMTLGSTKAPETTWTSSSAQEQVIIDLGQDRENFSVLYFAQVSRNDFSVSVSRDLEHWEAETWAQMDQGQCWKWKYVTESYDSGEGERTYNNYDRSNIILFSGRYVRITSCQIGLKLNEVLFRDESGKALPAVILSRSGEEKDSGLCSDPAALLDEQDSLEGLPVYFKSSSVPDTAQPSWWNSTYFDEIYHARTAYEFLKGTVPYETSHPPLGKILMSLSVAVFGMNPFGWRFAGALAGILMLPGMYLLGKQLTKKTGIAALACLLMSLDCLHLTQTQIATIDSFPVLFIIFSYFFMLRFMQTDLRRESMSRILLNLGACGLFMGLAIASKWIGIYAGAGLAVLFFLHCIRQIRVHAASSGGTESPADKDTGSVPLRILRICCWCCLFFVVVPLTIYLLSYIPYMAYNSARIRSLADYISEVWRAQVGMFSYHSTKNLGMDHPFYSPWWEWPIIGKPMYYASEQFIPRDSPFHHSIFCFGNPVIWYGALGAFTLCLFFWLRTKRYRIGDDPQTWHLHSDRDETGYLFIFIGLLAQYLPWVLVPRGTYIYHYFASLPFLMLAISVCFDGYRGIASRCALVLRYLLIILALIGFCVLFPYASGIASPSGWLDIGKSILRIWY